jgi:Reverse transcriptase (RNA-dependent DNA polymerase)
LIEFTSYVLNNLEDGIQIDAIYTDFSKAFDKVNHRLLLQKLSALGFGGCFLEWIASYLTDRKQYVKACGRRSRSISVNSGVPQGSHLGPLFFIIFINDITHCFKYLRFLLYADDLKVFFPIRGDEDFHRAQSELEILSRWCVDNELRLNLNKCKIISFTRGRATLRYDYELSNHTLERVDSIRDLGVLLDPKLDFRIHVDGLIVRAARMLGYVRRIGREFKDPYTLKTLYVSFVRSLLEYAATIWNPYYAIHANRIEAVQKKFLRFALRMLNWNRDLPLPPYFQRCRLLDLDTLTDRRRMSCVLLINDILCGKLDCANILCNLKLTVPSYITRNRVLLAEVSHRTNYGQMEPLNRAIRIFNEFSGDFEFGASRNVFRNKINIKLRGARVA